MSQNQQALVAEFSDEEKALAKTYNLNAKLMRDTLAVEAIVERYKPTSIARLPPMTQTVVLAKGMHELRQAMTKELVEYVFMPLQKSKLGFRTDRDKNKDGTEGDGYPWDVVRDVVIEAMMRGFRPTGNEMNIIGGNFYATLEGLERKVAEWPGLTNLELIPGVPALRDGSALVPYEALWRINGKLDHLECVMTADKDGVVTDHRIPVRVNSGQIIDAVMGKAKRKMLARIYAKLSGQKIPDGDVVDTVGEAVSMDERPQSSDATQDLIDKHKSKCSKGKKNGEAEPQREPGDDTNEISSGR